MHLGLRSGRIVRGFILHGVPRPGGLQCSPLVAHAPEICPCENMACVFRQTSRSKGKPRGGIQAETEDSWTENLTRFYPDMLLDWQYFQKFTWQKKNQVFENKHFLRSLMRYSDFFLWRVVDKIRALDYLKNVKFFMSHKNMVARPSTLTAWHGWGVFPGRCFSSWTTLLKGGSSCLPIAIVTVFADLRQDGKVWREPRSEAWDRERKENRQQNRQWRSYGYIDP